MGEPKYDLARTSWSVEKGSVCVMDAAGAFIADIPIHFMEQGLCNSWEYVLLVIKTCVEEQDGELHTPDGQVIPTASGSDDAPPIQNGIYTYKRRGEAWRGMSRNHDVKCCPGQNLPDRVLRAASDHSTCPFPKHRPAGPGLHPRARTRIKNAR